MGAIRDYEALLSREMLRVLTGNRAIVYGIADEDNVYDPVPTFCFNICEDTPQAIAEAMAQAGIGIRDGHMYAPHLMARLGLPWTVVPKEPLWCITIRLKRSTASGRYWKVLP